MDDNVGFFTDLMFLIVEEQENKVDDDDIGYFTDLMLPNAEEEERERGG